MEALANIISLGTLQVFTFVNAGVIVLRMKTTRQNDPIPTGLIETNEHICGFESSSTVSSPDEILKSRNVIRATSNLSTYYSVHLFKNKSIFFLLLFTLSVLFFSFNINHHWNSRLLFFLSAFIAASTSYFLLVHPKCKPPSTFQCPLVPFVPMLGIACNAYMMGSMPKNTWLNISFRLLGGCIIYIGYGMRYSKLRMRNKLLSEKRKSLRPNDDDDDDCTTVLTEVSPLIVKSGMNISIRPRSDNDTAGIQ